MDPKLLLLIPAHWRNSMLPLRWMGKHLCHSHLSHVYTLFWHLTDLQDVWSRYTLNTLSFLGFISSPGSSLPLHCSFNHCCLLSCRLTSSQMKPCRLRPTTLRLVVKPTDLLFRWLCVRTTSWLCACCRHVVLNVCQVHIATVMTAFPLPSGT